MVYAFEKCLIRNKTLSHIKTISERSGVFSFYIYFCHIIYDYAYEIKITIIIVTIFRCIVC